MLNFQNTEELISFHIHFFSPAIFFSVYTVALRFLLVEITTKTKEKTDGK